MNIAVPAIKPGLVDRFGRTITYLRVSVTDRCDFRCVYCMAEDQHFLPRKEVLSLEELDRLEAMIAEIKKNWQSSQTPHDEGEKP